MAPLPAASATRARNVASPDSLLWRVTNLGLCAAGAIAPLAGLGVLLLPAMSLVACVDLVRAFARAIGDPTRSP